LSLNVIAMSPFDRARTTSNRFVFNKKTAPLYLHSRIRVICWSGVRGKINRSVQLCSAVYRYVVVQFLEGLSLDWVLSQWAHFTVLKSILERLFVKRLPYAIRPLSCLSWLVYYCKQLDGSSAPCGLRDHK